MSKYEGQFSDVFKDGGVHTQRSQRKDDSRNWLDEKDRTVIEIRCENCNAALMEITVVRPTKEVNYYTVNCPKCGDDSTTAKIVGDARQCANEKYDIVDFQTVDNKHIIQLDKRKTL